MNNRKKWVNDNFFSEINSEEKAYILGFLYADGCIMKRGNSYIIKISLSIKDIDYLIYISKFLSAYKVKQYTTKTKISKSGIIENCEVSFRSSSMYNDLINIGMTRRKSLTLTFPENKIPNNLIHHFIRGYFDGDGSSYILNYKPKNRSNLYKKLGVTISGTKEFLEVLAEKANISVTNYNCVRKERRRKTNCYKYELDSTVKCLKFYNYIYKDATIMMIRKLEVFNNFLQERGSETIIAIPNLY